MKTTHVIRSPSLRPTKLKQGAGTLNPRLHAQNWCFPKFGVKIGRGTPFSEGVTRLRPNFPADVFSHGTTQCAILFGTMRLAEVKSFFLKRFSD